MQILWNLYPTYFKFLLGLLLHSKALPTPLLHVYCRKYWKQVVYKPLLVLVYFYSGILPYWCFIVCLFLSLYSIWAFSYIMNCSFKTVHKLAGFIHPVRSLAQYFLNVFSISWQHEKKGRTGRSICWYNPL